MTDIFGIYRDKEHVDLALERLIERSFTKDEISVVLVTAPTESDIAHSGHSTAVVTSGMALGGTLGLLAGFAAVAIPGLGPIRAAGPFLGMIAGAGIGGTVGGLIDFLYQVGLPRASVGQYEGALTAGQVVLTIHCDSDEKIAEAMSVVEETGAADVTQAERAAGK
jgi:hypothetical protein